jgi:hypothetical protein
MPGEVASSSGRRSNLLSRGKIGIEHAALDARPPVQELRQTVIGLRADHDVDERRALEHLAAFGLRHAAGDADQHVGAPCAPALAHLAQPAELRIHFLGRLFPDVAGVQDDQVRVVGAVGRDITVRHQSIRHTGGVVDVHLAAVGLDEQFLRHALATASRGTLGQRGQIDARIVGCHAYRLTLPHDIFMGTGE